MQLIVCVSYSDIYIVFQCSTILVEISNRIIETFSKQDVINFNWKLLKRFTLGE